MSEVNSMNDMQNLFKGEVVVDSQNMCVDRSTPLGQQFEAFNRMVAAEKDENRKAFLGQMSAYAEAAMVIDKLYPGEAGKEKIAQLAEKMRQS